jgi:hypothetical protein
VLVCRQCCLHVSINNQLMLTAPSA